MPGPSLHLAAYDIRTPQRLRRCHRILMDYACGGQKSVFECYLTPTERQTLLERVSQVLDLEEDRFLLVPLPAQRPLTLGKAKDPLNPNMLYVA